VGGFAYRLVGNHAWPSYLDRLGGIGAVGPGHVGGQDQGGGSAWWRGGRRDGLGGIRAEIGWSGGAPDPAGDRSGQRVDVRLKRRVVALVVRRVVTNDGQQRSARSPGIVQVGQPVRQARS